MGRKKIRYDNHLVLCKNNIFTWKSGPGYGNQLFYMIYYIDLNVPWVGQEQKAYYVDTMEWYTNETVMKASSYLLVQCEISVIETDLKAELVK